MVRMLDARRCLPRVTPNSPATFRILVRSSEKLATPMMSAFEFFACRTKDEKSVVPTGCATVPTTLPPSFSIASPAYLMVSAPKATSGLIQYQVLFLPPSISAFGIAEAPAQTSCVQRTVLGEHCAPDSARPPELDGISTMLAARAIWLMASATD